MQFKKYQFKDNDFVMDINVSIEERTIYMNQTELGILLDISQTTISRNIKKLSETKWDSYAEMMQYCITMHKTNTIYYSLEIIKEIGEKYNKDRIIKLEKWLSDLLEKQLPMELDNNYEIVRYNQDKISIFAKLDLDNRTAWLTQEDISTLLGVSIPNIAYHINNIYEEGELEEWATLKEFLIVRFEGNREVKRAAYHYTI